MFKMGLGMWLYDALSMFEAPELHERLNPEESLQRLPLLEKKDLVGSYVYSDAYMDDDRLTLETMRSAVKLGALAVNHVSASGAQLTNGKVSSITCTDHFTQTKFEIKAHHFISTVGPWTDEVASNLLGHWKKILRPSKGVHLTFDSRRLQLKQAVVMVSDDQKRIVFGIPRQEMTIIGTTDTDFQGNPYDVSTTAEDVKYLLHVASEYFPGAKLTADDIISTYAGVRPLVDDGSASESKTSREHVIIKDPRGVTFVAGGKYTTYRRMAEHTIVSALESFSSEDQVRFAKNDTKRPLNDYATISKMDESRLRADEWAEQFGFSKEIIDRLVERHASEALALLENETQNRTYESLRQSSQEDRLWEIEAVHAIHQTMCFGLVDFYVRRSPLFLARRDHGLPLIALLSKVFARELSWSDSRRQEEAASLQSYVRNELSWKQAFQKEGSTNVG